MIKLTDDERALYERTVNTWGESFELDMLVEECAEVILTVGHIRRGRKQREDLLEELADVSLMLESVVAVVCNGEEEFNEFRAVKLARLKERLNEWDKKNA